MKFYIEVKEDIRYNTVAGRLLENYLKQHHYKSTSRITAKEVVVEIVDFNTRIAINRHAKLTSCTLINTDAAGVESTMKLLKCIQGFELEQNIDLEAKLGDLKEDKMVRKIKIT